MGEMDLSARQAIFRYIHFYIYRVVNVCQALFFVSFIRVRPFSSLVRHSHSQSISKPYLLFNFNKTGRRLALLFYKCNVSNSFNGSDYNVTKKQSNIQQHPFIRSESNDILVYSVSVSIPWKWKHFRGIWFSSFFYFRRTPFGMK